MAILSRKGLEITMGFSCTLITQKCFLCTQGVTHKCHFKSDRQQHKFTQQVQCSLLVTRAFDINFLILRNFSITKELENQKKNGLEACKMCVVSQWQTKASSKFSEKFILSFQAAVSMLLVLETSEGNSLHSCQQMTAS